MKIFVTESEYIVLAVMMKYVTLFHDLLRVRGIYAPKIELVSGVAEGSRELQEYAQLLRQLHGLIRDGKNNSDEADAIREKMEDPWYAMNSDEHEQMTVLSVLLYAVAGDYEA